MVLPQVNIHRGLLHVVSSPFYKATSYTIVDTLRYDLCLLIEEKILVPPPTSLLMQLTLAAHAHVIQAIYISNSHIEFDPDYEYHLKNGTRFERDVYESDRFACCRYRTRSRKRAV